VEVAELVLGALPSTDITDRDWLELFRVFFDANAFTGAHAQFWTYALEQTSGAEQVRVGLVSGYWACEAVRAGLKRVNQGAATDASMMLGLQWLRELGPAYAPDARSAIFDLLEGILTPWQGAGPRPALAVRMVDAESAGLWAEVATTVRRYAPRGAEGRSRVAAMLGLQGGSRQFWDSHGVFLFDNGALDEWQRAGLDKAMGAIPADLHALDAFFVPEGLNIDPRQVGWSGDLQLALIPLIPMRRLSDPTEFTPYRAQPVAPEFSLVAAQEIMRAVQAFQFARRPWLQAQRDTILSLAGDTRESYIRRFVPPSVYLNQPDQLLPAVAYLWFIDSERTFWQALDLFDLNERYAMDTVLLLADILSGGGGSTWIYATDERGQIARQQVPIARTQLGLLQYPDAAWERAAARWPVVDLQYVTGIGILGYAWNFDLNEYGGTIRWHRR
jgi:hypothetical protein